MLISNKIHYFRNFIEQETKESQTIFSLIVLIIIYKNIQYKIISKRFYVIFPIHHEDRVFLKHSQNNQILNVS